VIADNAQIALGDGTTKAAIELFPEADVLTYRNQKFAHATVVEKMIKTHDDVICLVLSNGQRLLGSREQRVCVSHDRRAWFTKMADIEIGMTLRGQAAGVLTVVRVVGILYFSQRQTRLVEFRFAHKDCFVAEGIWCR
jgi:hypothetical protein